MTRHRSEATAHGADGPAGTNGSQRGGFRSCQIPQGTGPVRSLLRVGILFLDMLGERELHARSAHLRITQITRWLGLLVCGALPILGCNGPPPPPKVSDLEFPVLVVYPDAGMTVFKDAQDLQTMSLQRILAYKDTAGLIDAKLRIFQLANLRSTKNGFAIWIDGGRGPTPVAFDLVATQESGPAAARNWICKGTSRFTEGPQAMEQRGQLEKASTFEELVAVGNSPP